MYRNHGFTYVFKDFKDNSRKQTPNKFQIVHREIIHPQNLSTIQYVSINERWHQRHSANSNRQRIQCKSNQPYYILFFIVLLFAFFPFLFITFLYLSFFSLMFILYLFSFHFGFTIALFYCELYDGNVSSFTSVLISHLSWNNIHTLGITNMCLRLIDSLKLESISNKTLRH